MSSLRLGIFGGLVGLAASGCGEPGAILPVAPPGANIPRQSPDAEPAVAQGEAAPMPDTSTSPGLHAEDYKPALPTAKGETKTTPRGVKYETLREGTGAELKFGEKAVLHYVGNVLDGEVFDSSRTTNKPMTVRIGIDPLIEGWAEAIPGMKVGEIRKLTIPPELAYKKLGRPPKIPGNATLVFEVELKDIVAEK